jgi:hypothetical protein
MSTIKRSKTDAFSVKESVNIVKLAEAAFEQISIDQLTDVVVETPTDGDILVYSSDLMAWENVPQAPGIGGSDTYVQFNDGGALGADAGLTYDKATGTLSATQTKTASVSGPDSVTGTQLRAGAGGTLSTLNVDPSATAPYFVTGGSVYEVQHTGNTKTVAGQSINGSGDIAINRTITAQFDGGSTDGNPNNIEVGDEVVIRSPYAITLSDWTLLLSDATGNVSIDVQTKPFSSGSFTSITSSGTPSAISGDSAEGTVSGWSSSSITSGHLIKLVVTARSGVVPRATLQLNGVQA